MKTYLIGIIILLILGELFYVTWKYSPYALYNDIQESRQRETLLFQECKLLEKSNEALYQLTTSNTKAINDLNYEVSVVASRDGK